MTEKKLLIRESELIYFTAIIIYIFTWTMCNSQFSEEYNFTLWRSVNYIVFPVLLFKLYKDRKYYGYHWRVILVLLLTLVTSYVAGGYTLLITVLFILSMRNVDYRKCLKLYTITLTICVVIILASCFMGVISDIVTRTARGDRHGLGFTYTTFLPNYFFHALLLLVLILKDNIKYWHIAILAVCNFFVYHYTFTNAVYYEVFLLLFCVTVTKALNLKLQQKIYKWLAIIAVPLMALIAFLCSYIYPGKTGILLWLNQILTNRLYLGHSAIQKYGIHLLGQNVVWNVGRGFDSRYAYFYVDSSFVNILLQYGGGVLLLVIVAYTWLFYKSYQLKVPYLYIVIFVLAIHSTWDPQLIDFKMNGLVLLLSGFFWGEKEDYHVKTIGALK